MVFRWLLFLEDDMPSVSVPSLYVNSVFCPLKISVQWARVEWRGKVLLPRQEGHTVLAALMSGVFLTTLCTGRLWAFLEMMRVAVVRVRIIVFVEHGTADASFRVTRLLGPHQCLAKYSAWISFCCLHLRNLLSKHDQFGMEISPSFIHHIVRAMLGKMSFHIVWKLW